MRPLAAGDALSCSWGSNLREGWSRGWEALEAIEQQLPSTATTATANIIIITTTTTTTAFHNKTNTMSTTTASR
jgi:hypothetical protein